MAPVKYGLHDRTDKASYIATIGATSSTRGSYSQLEGGDLLKNFGPQDLTTKNSLEKASISVAEEYEPWGYPSPSRLKPLQWLIPMRDDYEWIMNTSDYRELYYTGLHTPESGAEMYKLVPAIEDNLYYMYLKRAAIVPVGLPRTSAATDFGDADGSKKAGFLDPDDYFRYTSSLQYYGELGGIWNADLVNFDLTVDDPDYYEGGSGYLSNDINWKYLGRVTSIAADAGAAGSWYTFEGNYYYKHAPGVELPGTIGNSGDVGSPTDNYSAVSLNYVMAYSKNLIKIQSTSVTKQDFKGFEQHTDAWKAEHGDDYVQTDTGFQMSDTSPKNEAGVKTTDEMGFVNPDGNTCTSAIGAFLYEYCGPLYPHGLIIEYTLESPEVDDLGQFISLGEDTDSRHPYFTSKAPLHTGWHEGAVEGDGHFVNNGVLFSGAGRDATTALEIRFESDSRSLGRAHAYIDYYTGYLYELVEQDPIPREYKTKMQATPKLDPVLMSAVTGEINPNYSPPSTSEVSTATATSDMGSSY